jgi:hypothetical protein
MLDVSGGSPNLNFKGPIQIMILLKPVGCSAGGHHHYMGSISLPQIDAVMHYSSISVLGFLTPFLF